MTTPESYDGPVIPLVLHDGTTIEITRLNTRVIKHLGEASMYDAIRIDNAIENEHGKTAAYLFKQVWDFLVGDYDKRAQELIDRDFQIERRLEVLPEVQSAYDNAMSQTTHAVLGSLTE